MKDFIFSKNAGCKGSNLQKNLSPSMVFFNNFDTTTRNFLFNPKTQE